MTGLHRHRDVVVLPDGTEIIASSWLPDDPYTREEPPDFGLYLDTQWQPPWPHTYVDWPDFGIPADPVAVSTALHELLERARAGERVEIGCLGGHGRTGTTLACLAKLTGSADPVTWVREHYCAHAVETNEQHAFVATFAP